MAMKNFTKLLTHAGFEEKPHQTEGVQWCLDNETKPKCDPFQGIKGGILADDMGLGKTIQMIGLILVNPKPNTLIVVPLPLLDQWHREIKRTTGHSAMVFHGSERNSFTQEEVQKAPIVITTYHMIGVASAKAQAKAKDPSKVQKPSLLHSVKWSRIIYDEAHHLRNKSTNGYTGAIKLREVNQTAATWLLTGTPIHNSMSDFRTLCCIIGIPSEVSIKADNMAIIAQEFILRRTKEQLKLKIPKMTVHEPIVVKWGDDEERELADQLHTALSFPMMASYMEHDKDGELVATPEQIQQDKANGNTRAVAAITTAFNSMEYGGCVFPYILRSQQMCTFPMMLKGSIERFIEDGLIDTDETDADGEMQKVMSVLNSSSKLDAVTEHLVARNESPETKDNSAIVFARFTSEIDELKRRLTEAGMSVAIIDGRSTKVARKKVLNVAKPYDVLIVQIQAGCEGLNLQAYNDVYFISPHWNPCVEDQAMARAWRIGQEREVNVFRFQMEKFSADPQLAPSQTATMDKYCQVVQEVKRDMANELLALTVRE